MKKLILMIAMSALFLVGCEGESLTYEQAENQQVDEYCNRDGLLSWIAVGSDLRVEKVSLSDHYSLLFETGDGSLQWVDVSTNKNCYTFAMKKSDTGYTHLERLPNIVGQQTFPYETYYMEKGQLILYLATDDLQGGSYKKDCGENCTKRIDVDMVN